MIWAILSILTGGVLKGATGAGVPIFAIPALTMIYDVRLAVAVMVVPNLLSNLWQAWVYRANLLPARFVLPFALAGVSGVVVDSLLLAWLPAEALSLAVAFAVLGYIAIRLLRPAFWIPPDLAARLSVIAGLAAGALQGATGLSAPISLSFLNAMRLERPQFIGTVSVFFVAMMLAQFPALFALGILDLGRVLLGFGALGLVMMGMPLGVWIGRRMSAVLFDRVILAVLGLVALRILFVAVTGSSAAG